MNKEIIIIGGGASLIGFDFKRLQNRECIAVNQSLFDLPSAKYFITMDNTWLEKVKTAGNIEKFQQHPAHKIFIANWASGVLQNGPNNSIIDIRYGRTYSTNLFCETIKSYESAGIGISDDQFRNGENSGFCALQWALLRGYQTIRLLGIDLTLNHDRLHYHGAYLGNPNLIARIKQGGPNTLDLFRRYWTIGLDEAKIKFPGVNIISHSKISKLNNILKYEVFI